MVLKKENKENPSLTCAGRQLYPSPPVLKSSCQSPAMEIEELCPQI